MSSPSTPAPKPSPAERLRAHWWRCEDCGEWLPGDEIYPWGPRDHDQLDEKVTTLCASCYRLRYQVEDRILEIVTAAPGQSLKAARIRADLQRFSVPQEMTDAALRRMTADGRLRLTREGRKA